MTEARRSLDGSLYRSNRDSASSPAVVQRRFAEREGGRDRLEGHPRVRRRESRQRQEETPGRGYQGPTGGCAGHTADTTDRDAARLLLARLRIAHPEITLVWADSGYSGELERWAKDELGLTMRISRRPAGARGFVVVPRRWVVERSLSWIMRARRLVRDYERLPQHSEAEISFSAITLMTRRLASGRIQPDRYPSSTILAAA